jgi:adenylate cyclase
MSGDAIVKANRVIVFTDIHSFSIAAKTLADQQYKFLQAMYETLGDIVVRHQGELVKYLGDGFISVFAEGREEEAIASALAMREAFRELVMQWGLPAETELEVGVGAGEVGIGVVGHSTFRQKEVYGEVVNEAARIGHHRGVAITELVYERVRHTYAAHRLADVAVKWREEPLRVWEVKR